MHMAQGHYNVLMIDNGGVGLSGNLWLYLDSWRSTRNTDKFQNLYFNIKCMNIGEN